MDARDLSNKKVKENELSPLKSNRIRRRGARGRRLRAKKRLSAVTNFGRRLTASRGGGNPGGSFRTGNEPQGHQKLKRAPSVSTRPPRACVIWPKLALAMLFEMLSGLKFKLLKRL